MKSGLPVVGKILFAIVIHVIMLSVGLIVLGVADVESQNVTFIVSTIAMIISVLIAYRLFGHGDQWKLGLRQAKVASSLVIGMGLGILLISLSFLAIWGAGGVRYESIQWDTSILTSVGISFCIFILVAVSEELLYRGYIQGIIMHHYNSSAAIIVSALIFAASHLMNPDIITTPIALFNIFLIGLFFGLTRVITNGLWLPIGFHLTWNFLQGNLYGFAVSGTDAKPIISTTVEGNSYISGGTFGAEGSVLTAVLILILCLITVTMYAKRIKQKPISL